MSKNILLLGAGSDLAQAMADIYAARKDKLMLAGRDTTSLERIKSDLEVRYSADVSLHLFDACAPETHEMFYKSLPNVPDVVVCVFGYLGDTEKGMHDWAEADKILRTNYVGAVSILNVAATSMKSGGTIIGISSVAGERGRQSNFLYGSAKAGFTAYLSGLRNYGFHRGFHVLTVKPGFMKTAMTDGMKLNPALTAIPSKAAADIVSAADRKENVLYTLWMWKYIMLIIKNIPEFIFKKLKM